MAQYNQGHNERVAAFPPFSKNGPPPPINGPTKRNIPANHQFDPKALKPMSKALWAASVFLGHALTAYRHFTRLKSTSVSPDGMLGGRGFVMNVRDVRAKLNEAVEALSAISDTLHDEIRSHPVTEIDATRTVGRDLDPVSLALQTGRDRVGDGRLVLDHHDGT